MSKIYIGIDAGGTTTEFVAYLENGDKLKHHSDIGANLMNNREHAIDTVMSGLDQLVEEDWNIQKISIGMAGVVGNPLVATLKETILTSYPTKLEIYNDVVFAHKAIFKNQPGLLLSGGTGSIAILSEDAKDYSILGGYGHLFGDEGSGYDIARRALIYCMKMHDMQQTDLFTEAILKKLHVNNIREAIPYLYRSVKGDIADIAGIVAKLAEEDNQIAINILTESANSYVDYIVDILKARNIDIEYFALWGSVFTKNPIVSQILEEQLKQQIPTISKITTEKLEINQAVLF